MGGSGKPGLDSRLGTGETVSTGGLGLGDARPTQDLTTGMMVGEYQLEGLLGEGGMGRVYAATHPVIAKRAAIKILHPELSMNREAVERFVQEARSVNQIGHPNIVDIFAFGTLPDGRCYFVMEWLRGQSLRDRMRASAVPLDDALAILETITIALEAAHEKGIVHRDLKPDNIFLAEVKGSQPIVKLLDFGIAKLLGNDEARVERTRTGNLLGTPAYISPEQARGQDVDHRTDIYALGALAFELFTGSLPFPAQSAADMIAKHLYEPPPSLRQLVPGVPPALDHLITAMLAKDPVGRPTLAQVRAELRPDRLGMYVTGPGAHPQMPTPYPPMAAVGPTTGVSPTVPGPGSLGAGAPGVSTITTVPPARGARLPRIVLGAVVMLAAGIGVFVAVGQRAQPAAPQPAAAEPVTVEPTTAVEPAATEPVVEPVATEPAAVVKPVATEPAATEPAAVVEPVATEPATSPPERTRTPETATTPPERTRGDRIDRKRKRLRLQNRRAIDDDAPM